MADNFNAKGRAKSVGGYFIAGIAYVLVAGAILGFLADSIGVNTMGGLEAFGASFATFDILGIILGLVSFIILGTLVWIFAIIGIKIRKAFGNKDPEIKFSKRPFILALFITGVVTTVIFYGVNQVLGGLSPDADLTDVKTLLDAVTTFNPLLLVGAIAGLSVVGYLIIQIGRYSIKWNDKVPDPVKY